VHIERSKDLGKTWSRGESLNDGKRIGAIQPSLLLHGAGSMQFLCRTRQGSVYDCWSSDGGMTWGELRSTPLPNPNSGIDAVQLRDGRSLLVYNHTSRGRSPLNVAISEDGKTWRAGPVLESEPGEYSYPAVIQSADGLIQISYTWNRKKIRRLTLDPAKLAAGDPIGRQEGTSPARPGNFIVAKPGGHAENRHGSVVRERESMNHHDAEVSDVVIVLDDLNDEQTQEAVANLKAAGLDVVSVNNENSTVEGTIDALKVRDLNHVPRVRYVRAVMTYTVDYPPGDPRDLDGADTSAEDSDD
jgi:hypothetical protein